MISSPLKVREPASPDALEAANDNHPHTGAWPDNRLTRSFAVLAAISFSACGILAVKAFAEAWLHPMAQFSRSWALPMTALLGIGAAGGLLIRSFHGHDAR